MWIMSNEHVVSKHQKIDFGTNSKAFSFSFPSILQSKVGGKNQIKSNLGKEEEPIRCKQITIWPTTPKSGEARSFPCVFVTLTYATGRR